MCSSDLVARLFGARAAYALWLAPLARMLLPPAAWLPAAPSDAAAGILWTEVAIEPLARASSTLPQWLVPAWLGGAALYLAARLLAHYRFLDRALDEGRPLVQPELALDLVATPAVEGPLATGLVHKLVLVPTDFDERFTPEQQRLALAHEALHHQRGDLWACTAALVLVALNWFNPLAHVALGAFRRDMEAACDAQLLACERACTAAAYAETLLRCAARPVPRSLCALTSIDELKGRLTMLTNNPTILRRFAGLTLAGLLAAGGLTLSLPAAAQDNGEPTKEIRKEVRIIETDGPNGEKVVRLEGPDGDLKRECPGEMTSVSADAAAEAAGKKEKAFIMICSKPGEGKDAAVKGLERALARIQSSTDMDPAIKAELSAKLQTKISEVKAR